VPEEQVADLIRLGNQMIGSDDPEYVGPVIDGVDPEEFRLLPFAHPAALDAFRMVWEVAGARRANPTDDVLTALALGEVEGRRLSDQELGTYFVLLVIAGNETTRHTISSGVAALAGSPEQWEALRAGDVDLNRAADEVIRWASAIHFHRRMATRDVEIGETQIRAGEKVALYFASANFDEEVFTDPFRFDLRRSPNEHVSFGRGGPHFCLGAHLARLEVRVVLEELAARVSRIELLGPPVRLRSNHINGLKHLPVGLVRA
jgi:cytochrome P450